MFDALASPQPSENIEFLIQAIAGKDQRDRLAYGLFRCLSKESLGTCIPTGDHPL